MIRFSAMMVLLLLAWLPASSQTLGGKSAFPILSFPVSPLRSATGGLNNSLQSGDAGFATANPALLRSALHSQLSISFTEQFNNAAFFSLSGAYYLDKLQTSLGGQVSYINYGTIERTDASGNVYGSFRALETVVQLGAGRKYLEKWYYGINLKYIHANYDQFRSFALAIDAGLNYEDSAKGLSFSLLAKNMGFQLKKFTEEDEELPFDLQVGITKQLANAPFGFSLTARQLHQFDLLFDDTTFNSENGLQNRNGFFNHLLDHFVIATHVYVGHQLEFHAGYNHLKRRELNLGNGGNGLNGFGLGLRGKFRKLEFQYARSWYQQNIAYNQFGLNLKLDQLVGL